MDGYENKKTGQDPTTYTYNKYRSDVGVADSVGGRESSALVPWFHVAKMTNWARREGRQSYDCVSFSDSVRGREKIAEDRVEYSCSPAPVSTQEEDEKPRLQ